MDEDALIQENELLALESIFEADQDAVKIGSVTEGDLVFRSGHFRICPQLENDMIKITFSYSKKQKQEGTVAETVTSVDPVHELRFLPPMTVSFILPHLYPSEEPPKFTLACKWLDRCQLTVLCEKLDHIWKENVGQEVLYTWFQFLQEETLRTLSINELNINQGDFMETRKMPNLDPRTIQDVTCFSDILSELLEFNEMQMIRSFENTIFACNVCFQDKFGKDCLRFKDCQHVYCKQCISAYFDVQIKDGNIKSLTCPEPKCTSEAYPAQVKELVSSADFARYEALLLQTTLDTMNDVMYCPRKHCQSPVVVDPDDTIGICSVCKFSFCPYCKLAYHGVAPCRLKAAALREMCDKYKNADSETKKEMEMKYGAKVLIKTLQDVESEEWIIDNSKNCPGCGAAIEKNDGCNKMTCYKCKVFFCWICMSRLNRDNPYNHYNTFGSKCFNKLFEGVDTMQDDDWFYF